MHVLVNDTSISCRLENRLLPRYQDKYSNFQNNKKANFFKKREEEGRENWMEYYRQQPHSLTHVILSNGKYINENGECVDKIRYEKEKRDFTSRAWK